MIGGLTEDYILYCIVLYIVLPALVTGNSHHYSDYLLLFSVWLNSEVCICTFDS